MPYVRRSTTGQISALFQTPETETQEFLPATAPEIAAFLGKSSEERLFSKSDEDLIRVLEDLIDVLISKNVFRLTDLPAPAQEKLLSRKRLRQQLSKHHLDNLLDTDRGLI
ncbi:MAG: hypothetical protein H6R07_616 [Proteobacteria bacterium]|nr:hypothetical protein [Pseudomonadota bacterium]